MKSVFPSEPHLQNEAKETCLEGFLWRLNEIKCITCQALCLPSTDYPMGILNDYDFISLYSVF